MEDENLIRLKYVDKIRGLLYGLLLDKPDVDSQLRAVIDSIDTGELNLPKLVKLFKSLDTKDVYIQEVTQADSYIEDPSKSVYEVYDKYAEKEHACLKLTPEEYKAYCEEKGDSPGKIQIDHPITILRAMIIGVFSNWENYSTAACMVTHASHECILSSMIINCVVHLLILEDDITSEKIAVSIEVILQYGLKTTKSISQEIYAELMLFFEDPLRRKIRSINGSESEYTAFNVASTAVSIAQRYVDKSGDLPELIFSELEDAKKHIPDAENKDYIITISAALMCTHCGFDRLVEKFGENKTAARVRELTDVFFKNISLI